MLLQIKDNMTAEEVWDVLTDILHTVRVADPTPNKEVFNEVNDYVSTNYGD